MGLPRKDRLRKNEDFERILSGGKSVADPRLVVYYIKRTDRGRAIGISVGRRLGNAVLRNRYKRRLRELMRKALPHIRSGYSLVILLRRGGVGKDFSELEKSLFRLLKRARLWQEEEEIKEENLSKNGLSGIFRKEGDRTDDRWKGV